MSNVVALRQPDDGGGVSLDEYVEYLFGEGLAPKTIRVYSRMLGRSSAWLAEHRGKTLDDAGPYDLVELAGMFPGSRSSLQQLRAALGHYWTMTGRYRPPVKAIRVPRESRELVSRALEDDEAVKLAAVANGRHPEGTAVMLGLYLALRCGEIARARWDRFDDAMEWYTVENIKGGATDRLPVHPMLRDHLDVVAGALKVLGQNRDGWIFPGRTNLREFAAEATIWKWVGNLTEEAGLGRVHTHRLRHTALTTANDRTGDLRAVSRFARHERIATTMRYTRTTESAMEKVMESLDYTMEEE